MGTLAKPLNSVPVTRIDAASAVAPATVALPVQARITSWENSASVAPMGSNISARI